MEGIAAAKLTFCGRHCKPAERQDASCLLASCFPTSWLASSLSYSAPLKRRAVKIRRELALLLGVGCSMLGDADMPDIKWMENDANYPFRQLPENRKLTFSFLTPWQGVIAKSC